MVLMTVLKNVHESNHCTGIHKSKSFVALSLVQGIKIVSKFSLVDSLQRLLDQNQFYSQFDMSLFKQHQGERSINSFNHSHVSSRVAAASIEAKFYLLKKM